MAYSKSTLPTRSSNGTEGNDFIFDTFGDDVIYALGGNDMVIISTGNDYADGGDGTDTAILKGGQADYTMMQYPQSNGTVVLMSEKYGTVQLDNFEFIAFGDGTRIELEPTSYLSEGDKSVLPEYGEELGTTMSDNTLDFVSATDDFDSFL